MDEIWEKQIYEHVGIFCTPKYHSDEYYDEKVSGNNCIQELRHAMKALTN